MFPGNNYPLWLIDEKGRVCYADSLGQATPVSGEDFASDIAISDEGVIWALTTTPDPEGGGAEIAWLDNGLSWKTITTQDPGAFAITGGPKDQCLFLSSKGVLYRIDTKGEGQIVYNANPILEIDYGGGKVWGVLSDKPGEIPQLHYAELSDSIQWKEFKGVQSPTSLSVNYNGDCVGIENFNPYIYSIPDSTDPFGSGVQDMAMQISFKNNPFLMISKPTKDGNPIYEWQDEDGGTWMETSLKGDLVLSTYYSSGKS